MPERTKGQKYMWRFAWAIQRFRSIVGEFVTQEEFNLLYGHEFIVSEESVEKFRDFADRGIEFGYDVLFGLRAMAQHDGNPALRIILFVADWMGDDETSAEALMREKLQEIKEGKL